MLGWRLICLVVFLKILGVSEFVCSVPITDRNTQRYDEFVIEHEISAQLARNAALAIDLSSLDVPAGCQKCTRFEITYCLGRDFINDHCCCDMRYHEYLPFIPHTCYLGAQLCKPIAEDCAVYNRLRECCCNQYVLQKWKSDGSYNKNVLLMLLLTALVCLCQ